MDFHERCDIESCDSDDGDDMEPLVDSKLTPTHFTGSQLSRSDLETHVETVPSGTSNHLDILYLARASRHSCLVSLLLLNIDLS